MKTRIIHTRFWQDAFITSLNKIDKLIFIYLLTNNNVNTIGIYELPDKYILNELDITQRELNSAKNKFTNRIIFYEGWIKIVNADKYNSYCGEKTDKAKQRELSEVPEYLKNWKMDTSIGGVSGSPDTTPNHNIEIINHNGVVKGKEILDNPVFVEGLKTKFPDKDIPIEIEKMKDWLKANGKKKSDYHAFARNWLRNSFAGDKPNGSPKVYKIR